MIEKFFEKLCEVLSSVWGWVLFLVMVAVDFVSGYEVSVCIAMAAVVLDAIWGIASSIKQGRFALSELGRDSLSKLAVYGSVMFFFICVDKLIGGIGLTVSVVCACIVLVELWSSSASMLICYPKMPFLQLIRKALTGEIARKLSVEPKDVERILYNSEKQ